MGKKLQWFSLVYSLVWGPEIFPLYYSGQVRVYVCDVQHN